MNKQEFFDKQLGLDQLIQFLSEAKQEDTTALLNDAGATRRQWLYQSWDEAGDISYETLNRYTSGRASEAETALIQSLEKGDAKLREQIKAIREGAQDAVKVADRQFAPAKKLSTTWVPAAAVAVLALVGGALFYPLSQSSSSSQPAKVASKTESPTIQDQVQEAKAGDSNPSSSSSGSGGGVAAGGGLAVGGNQGSSSEPAKESEKKESVKKPNTTVPAPSTSDIEKRWLAEAEGKAPISSPTGTKKDETQAKAATESLPRPQGLKLPAPVVRSAPSMIVPEKPAPKPKPTVKPAPVRVASRPINAAAEIMREFRRGKGTRGASMAKVPVASAPASAGTASAGSNVGSVNGAPRPAVDRSKTGAWTPGRRFVYVRGFRKRVVWRRVGGVRVPGYIQWRGHVKRWYPLKKRYRVAATAPASKAVGAPVEVSTGNDSGQVIRSEVPQLELSGEALDLYRARTELVGQGPEPFELQGPVQAVVEEDQPLLTWQPVAGATRYQVDVDRLGDGGLVERQYTASTESSQTRLPEPLARGHRYRWRVTAIRENGEQVLVATRRGKQAEFGVISAESKERLDRTRRGVPSLFHAAELARVGLFEAAIEEINAYQRVSPSPEAEQLLDRIKEAVARTGNSR